MIKNITTMEGVAFSKEMERRFLIAFIQLYRQLPALWDVKSKIYHDREAKNRDYDQLLLKYQELYPMATKDDVKRKINSLRTNFRKELKKKREKETMFEYINSMNGEEASYTPTLWYFKEMEFLTEQEEDNDMKIEDTSLCTENYSIDGNAIESVVSAMDESESDKKDAQALRKKNLRNTIKNEDKLLSMAYEQLSEKKDEYYYWAMASAADIRKMDPLQQVFAKKAIAEILMEGQLGQLHRHSVKINSSV